MNAHIRCGLSTAFHNKQNTQGDKSAFGSSFVPSQVSLADFVAHITSGKAWTQGYFKGRSRRKEAFISAQTLALDLDDHVSVTDALAQPLIAEYALLVHPSPSSQPEYPKTRVVFVLSQPVTDAHEWETLQRGLIAHFEHLRPDPACKDAARLFFGSDIGPAHVNLGARLPLDVIQGIVRKATQAAQQAAAQPQTANASGRKTGTAARQNRPDTPHIPTQHGELPADLIRDVEQALGVAGSAYNKEGFSNKAIACPVKHHEHDGHNPAAYWHHDKHFLHCFKCGADYTTHDVAAALGLDVSAYYPARASGEKYNQEAQEASGITPWDRVVALAKKAPHAQHAPALPHLHHPDITVNLRYIGEMDTPTGREILNARGVLLRSPIGTGKTHLAAMLVKALGWVAEQKQQSLRVLALTHRQALAENLADRLSVSGEPFECYKGLDAADLRRIPRLSICYDSVYKLAAVGEKLPEYDLIIIDEVEQFHQHLGGNTMRGSAPERAYSVLRQLVKETPRILAMDAHLSDISRAWVEGVTNAADIAHKDSTPLYPTNGRIISIENVHREDRGTMTLHRYKDHAIATAMELAQRDEGTVVIPTNSRSMAKKLGHLFSEMFGQQNVLVIHGQNANNRDMQGMIRNINKRISQYRVVIYSPSLGTGVDITTPVRAVVGVFSHQPISPMDMHQMMGRCRVAKERHAWVEGRIGTLDTEWKNIYQRHERNALVTGFYCQFDSEGILAITDMQRAMLKLLSLLEAQRNRAMNDPLTAFVLLAKQAGFTLGFNETYDEETHAQVEAAGDAVQAAEKAAVLAAQPVSHEDMEAHLLKGTLTPEIQAGYERYKIESCVGLDVDTDIYDDLHRGEQREALRRFTDLEADEADLQLADRHDAAENTLLIKRRHRAMRRRLLVEAIRAMWGKDHPDATVTDLLQIGAEEELTEEEIAARLEGFLAARWHDLQTYLGWRADQSHVEKSVLRWLMAQIGLHLVSKQRMVEGERFRVYRLNAEQVAKMLRYAAARRAMLAEIDAKTAQKSGQITATRTVKSRYTRAYAADYSKRVYTTPLAQSE